MSPSPPESADPEHSPAQPARAAIPLSRPASPSPPGEGEIDLTDALGGMQGSSPPVPAGAGEAPGDPAASFHDFRREVEKQSGVDQSAQHMTLARTYLEMGMIDEAVGSLEVAARSPLFRFEAASRLGRILAGRGDTVEAIEHLERAAEAPAPTAEDGRALLYDLGSLVEQHGDTSRALAIFLELQSEAGDYRDVAQRVERLARVETGG
jgi:tetratricopeptide (TPR) repeat protein